jgi:glycogen synthase
VKIALIGNWPPPHGGVSVHVAALARVLAERGVDVRVLDIGEGDHRGGAVRPARGPLRFAARLVGVAAEGRLVHLHTNGANPKSWIVALGAGRARRPFGPRGVLTIHSGLSPGWLRASAGRRALAAAACAGFGRVIAVNEEIAGALADAGVASRRIAVVAPFSPAVLGAREPPEALAPFRLAHAPVFAAALAPGPTYGADLLLPAFRRVRERLPEAGLVVFGPGTAALGRPGVLALGEIAHGAALAVIGSADVFVRPTRADGDAVSVREALALGRVVVATSAGHRPAGCLLVPRGDAAALAARMVEAASVTPPPQAPAGGPDPFDTILATYASLAAARPLPDGGRRGVRAPTF